MRKVSSWFRKIRRSRDFSIPSIHEIKYWFSEKMKPDAKALPDEPASQKVNSEHQSETIHVDDNHSGDPLITENLALKQRVVELEAYVHELKGHMDKWGTLPSKEPQVRWRVILLLVVALLLASIPPVFVVLERWFNYFGVDHLVARLWTKPEFLNDIAVQLYVYPAAIASLLSVIFVALVPHKHSDEFRPNLTELVPYPKEAPALSGRMRIISRIFEVISAVGFVSLLILGFTRNYVPGWGLILVILSYMIFKGLTEIPPDRIREFIHSRGFVILSVFLFHVSLIILLASYYSDRRAIGAILLLLILSLINLLVHRKRTSPMVWIVSLAIILYTVRINSWLYSTIGDEYSFYFSAKSIVNNQSLLQIGSRIFDGSEVYGSHPYFSSILQAVSMWFLGDENFGWRFSSPYLVALSLPFFYHFFKEFLSKRTALIMTLLMAMSQYISNFGKIGYNNLQALFVMSVVLWVAGRAIRKKQTNAFLWLGMAVAACFYVYPVALYVIPLPILLLLLYLPPFSRSNFRLWVYMVAGFMLLFMPLIFQQDYWEAKVAGTLFYRPEIARSTESLLYHFGSNLFYTWLSYFYIVEETHFVVSSYLDPVTAIFIPIGIGLTLRSLRKSRFAIFLLIAFFLECFLVGASHDRRFPAVTRMFLLLPWFTVFSAMGLGWVVEMLQRARLQPIAAMPLIALLLVIILGVNQYQANVLFPRRTEGEPSLEVLFLRFLQHDQRVESGREKVYLFVTDSNWGIDGLRTMQEVYQLPESKAQLVRAEIIGDEFPLWMQSRFEEENTVVILQPTLDVAMKNQLKTALVDAGKVFSPVRNTPRTHPQFEFWYDPSFQGLFEPVRGTW